MQNEEMKVGWAKRFDFCIQVASGGEGGNTIPQHLQYFFFVDIS